MNPPPKNSLKPEKEGDILGLKTYEIKAVKKRLHCLGKGKGDYSTNLVGGVVEWGKRNRKRLIGGAPEKFGEGGKKN